MNGDFDAAMAEAERELKAALKSILGELGDTTLLDAVAESIHSYGVAKGTPGVTVGLEDGRTVLASVCPGQPITARVV
jgi:hypothetical protein